MHVPPKLFAYTLAILATPIALIWTRIKSEKKSWREQIIDYLDRFTPEFRFEHTPEETETWYTKRNYREMRVTIRERFGFGIYGIKR